MLFHENCMLHMKCLVLFSLEKYFRMSAFVIFHVNNLQSDDSHEMLSFTSRKIIEMRM